MKPTRLAPLLVVAVLALSALAAANAALPTNECSGIRECLRAQGPWVAVPKNGWAEYLLDCPRRRGIAAGFEAVATSPDVHVMWQAELGSPASPGRSTSRYGFFRAISATQRPGYFQPRLGCVPISPPSRSTTAVKVTIPGSPLSYVATNLRLKPGTAGRTRIACVPGQRLVSSWTAVAFRTADPPPVGLAAGIQVERGVTKGRQVTVSIAVSEAMPPGVNPELQLGGMCAQP